MKAQLCLVIFSLMIYCSCVHDEEQSHKIQDQTTFTDYQNTKNKDSIELYNSIIEYETHQIKRFKNHLKKFDIHSLKKDTFYDEAYRVITVLYDHSGFRPTHTVITVGVRFDSVYAEIIEINRKDSSDNGYQDFRVQYNYRLNLTAFEYLQSAIDSNHLWDIYSFDSLDYNFHGNPTFIEMKKNKNYKLIHREATYRDYENYVFPFFKSSGHRVKLVSEIEEHINKYPWKY